MNPNYKVTQGPTGGLIKHWTEGVLFEEQARKQLENISTLPFIHKHVAAMPDVHLGKGATVGSVIPTKGAIIPAALGVDIGCGMAAYQLPLTASDLPDSLAELRSEIEKVVPHGRTNNGGPGDRGAWGQLPNLHLKHWDNLVMSYHDIVLKHPKIEHKSVENHLGTLGTGNHFIEICLDEAQNVWIMLHSGSRGPGNKIGQYFIEKAKEEMRRFFINLPDKDLAYLPEGSTYFDDYVKAVDWAQNYARVNRELMAMQVISVFANHYPGKVPRAYNALDLVAGYPMAVNCHHNYASKENHFGENVYVTRKGAVRARKGDLGLIPGSMGTRSYVVRGKGNPDSFHSCSHGAGRSMSRTEAKKKFTLEDHAKAMVGVEARLDADIIDETPAAYKDVEAVMAAQSDLVEVVHTLKQVLCVKG